MLAARVAPAGVVAVEVADGGQSVGLHPEEEALVAHAADKRRRDFALGRFCARVALTRLGTAETALLRGADGAPLWPEGVAGSITHTRGYAATLVARVADYRSMGVDAERIGGVTDRLMPRLFDRVERDFLDNLNAAARSQAATILFSAKEAWFKAWSPLVSRPLVFTDIQILLDDDGFAAAQPGVGRARGRYAVEGDLVVTSVCLAAGTRG